MSSHLLPIFSPLPICLEKGEGLWLTDTEGNRYLDGFAGIAVNGVGHNHPRLVAALKDQVEHLIHCSNYFRIDLQESVAAKICEKSGMRGCFFCNSGLEANEAAIKLARRYMRKVRKQDAYEIITLSSCFHGRTFGALAATGRESLSDGFTPLPEGFCQVEAGNLAALEAAIGPQTAAVMLEVVQGEGGVLPLPADYLQGVERLCRAKGILLICDEVQAGLCRTGKFWAYQNFGLTPDIISCAKALANGLPMGAMLATDEVAQGFVAGSHATTFGGGALVSAVAAKTVEILRRDHLDARAAALGAEFRDKAEALRKRLGGAIVEVRGLGLMIGIELAEDGTEVWRELLRRGIICNLSHGKTLRLLPALTIDAADLDTFLETLEAILSGR